MSILDVSLRNPMGVLPENEATASAILERVKARRDNPEALYEQIEKAAAGGEPGLLDQSRPNYITDEVLARSFAMDFGLLEMAGGPDQLPEFTYLEPDSVSMFEVVVSNAKVTSRRNRLYRVQETGRTTGIWQEIQTEPVEIPFINPIFPRKRAILDAQANDKAAYAMLRELDRIAWLLIGNAKKSSFSGLKIYTFTDADVVGIPGANSSTSSGSFWKTLRTNVIPYFQGFNRADQVINIHIRHTDLQYLWQVAPLGASLGGFSDFQRKVFDGNVTDIVIYGHRFRVIPENNRIASGEMYCTVGPVFKFWLPPMGNVTLRRTRDDGSEILSIHRIYSNLQPSVWFKNLYYTTWSISDTNG